MVLWATAQRALSSRVGVSHKGGPVVPDSQAPRLPFILGQKICSGPNTRQQECLRQEHRNHTCSRTDARGAGSLGQGVRVWRRISQTGSPALSPAVWVAQDTEGKWNTRDPSSWDSIETPSFSSAHHPAQVARLATACAPEEGQRSEAGRLKQDVCLGHPTVRYPEPRQLPNTDARRPVRASGGWGSLRNGARPCLRIKSEKSWGCDSVLEPSALSPHSTQREKPAELEGCSPSRP